MGKVKENIINCLAPTCKGCENTSYIVTQEAIKIGEPVEFVSKDAATGRVTVKKLTDATKLYGVAIEDAEANVTALIIDRLQVRAEPIVMPDGLLKKDLAVDTINAPHLILIKGV